MSSEQWKKYYEKNREKILAKNRLWYKNNPEKANEIAKKSRLKHRERHKLRCKIWRMNNPYKFKQSCAMYRAKKRLERDIANGTNVCQLFD